MATCGQATRPWFLVAKKVSVGGFTAMVEAANKMIAQPVPW